VAKDVRILTVDDQPPFRDAARRVIEATPGFESVGELTSAEEAFDFLSHGTADIVIMDVRMPGTNGLEAAQRLSRERPDVVVVLVSGEPQNPGELAGCGARGFASKRDFGPALLRRLQATYL
jgi:two-component system, NarL family, invasion response regulator UvrY